ncbi:MAG: hypothetical protein QE271_04820 [Bacteriovoracaceae bacterium]|nr:hypothetical protein [Bacteriovoracaceae bacterium]
MSKFGLFQIFIFLWCGLLGQFAISQPVIESIKNKKYKDVYESIFLIKSPSNEVADGIVLNLSNSEETSDVTIAVPFHLAIFYLAKKDPKAKKISYRFETLCDFESLNTGYRIFNIKLKIEDPLNPNSSFDPLDAKLKIPCGLTKEELDDKKLINRNNYANAKINRFYARYLHYKSMEYAKELADKNKISSKDENKISSKDETKTLPIEIPIQSPIEDLGTLCSEGNDFSLIEISKDKFKQIRGKIPDGLKLGSKSEKIGNYGNFQLISYYEKQGTKSPAFYTQALTTKLGDPPSLPYINDNFLTIPVSIEKGQSGGAIIGNLIRYVNNEIDDTNYLLGSPVCYLNKEKKMTELLAEKLYGPEVVSNSAICQQTNDKSNDGNIVSCVRTADGRIPENPYGFNSLATNFNNSPNFRTFLSTIYEIK